MSTSIESLLAQFPRLKIGLVGDLFLDRYLDIEPGVQEISLETGLEAYHIASVRNSPGALGTVMNNLAALGVGRLVPVTVIGDDGHGFDLLHELCKLPVDTTHVLRDSERLTPTYTKPLKQDGDGQWRELNRLDVRSRVPLSDAMTGHLIEHVRAVFEQCDGLLVLDQVNETNWGVVNEPIRDLLTQLAMQTPDKLVFIDSRTHLGHFPRGVLKGNRGELFGAVTPAGADPVTVEQAAQQLARKTGQEVYVTLGEGGILVVSADGTCSQLPGYAVHSPIDTVGAGDSASSGIVAALLSGATPLEAAHLGNLVASITIQQLGTTGTASPAQVLARSAEW